MALLLSRAGLLQVNPSHLVGLLWNMHAAKGRAEATYPEAILNR